MDLSLAHVHGIARAQRVTRAVIHEVAAGLAAGDTERAVVRRIEEGLVRAGVRAWLHTPYAWWGERTCFAGFGSWEPDALPTERALENGEPFILDAAPFVEGHPADYAFSGVLGGDGAHAPRHAAMRKVLAEIKERLVGWAASAPTGRDLFESVGAAVTGAGFEAVHPKYPGAVLGHSFDVIPRALQRLPRIGDGFQLPLVAGYAIALLRHRLAGAPYPLVNHVRADRPRGVFAMEPHLGGGDIGAKFESILVIDGDETRWLDPGLYGEVDG